MVSFLTEGQNIMELFKELGCVDGDFPLRFSIIYRKKYFFMMEKNDNNWIKIKNNKREKC